MRSERLELDIVNSEKKLLPGMIADVKIPLSLKDSTFVIPITALLDSEEGFYVFKSESNAVQKVALKIGRSRMTR